MSNAGTLPEILGHQVAEDEAGNVCLNDLYQLAGRPENQRPNDWHRGKRAKALEAALNELITENFRNCVERQTTSTFYVVGRGPASRTFAHPVLALDYAEYLSPKIGVKVREVFLRYRAADISLANDILDRIAEQVQEDEWRINNRHEMTVRNRELASQAKKAGCSHFDYAELHNSGYRGLYNGLDAVDIHRLKKLTKSQKILDHMCAAEGAANVFRATQAKIRMEREKPETPGHAFRISREAGERTRQAMKEIGGVMPEDLPVPDSISVARKRLKIYKEALPKDRN